MHGTGVPLVTPFDASGDLDEEKLRRLVGWLEDRGVDFLVPCGSTGEAPLMSVEECATAVEVVADAATVPVLAGTGRPGYRETLRATEQAAEAGADAALVVTPYYYGHGDAATAAHYRDLAGESAIPVYLYSVPKFTGSTLSPRTVEALAAHEGIAGMKDSAGDLDALQRTRELTRELTPGFDLLVGHGGIYAHGLAAGADGGVLAVGNAAPELVVEIHERHGSGDETEARELNRRLLELNRAVTARYGVPGAKAALRIRGAPAGRVRRPLEPLADAAEREIESLLVDLDLL